MRETRLEKYKEYRSSLNGETKNSEKDDKKVFDTNNFKDTAGSTSTLPIEEVLSALEEDEKDKQNLINKQKTQKIFFISLCVIGLLALLILIIYIGSLIF